jgi:hypothetical protein
MPVEHPSAPLSSTASIPGDESVGSARGERQSVVLRVLRDASEERSQRTSRVKATLETAAESPRPKKRFPHLMPVIEPAREDFGLLEKWDGVVLTTEDDTFTARLYRADEPSRTTQAVFFKSELSPEERGQIQEGASFVWTIGYRHIGTTRHRDSVIYFRRLVPWERTELKMAEFRGAELKNTIGW